MAEVWKDSEPGDWDQEAGDNMEEEVKRMVGGSV